jgi:hypothetical protein
MENKYFNFCRMRFKRMGLVERASSALDGIEKLIKNALEARFTYTMRMMRILHRKIKLL